MSTPEALGSLTTELQSKVLDKYLTDPKTREAFERFKHHTISEKKLREEVLKKGGLYDNYQQLLHTIDQMKQAGVPDDRKLVVSLQRAQELKSIFSKIHIREYTKGRFGGLSYLAACLKTLFDFNISIFNCNIVENKHPGALQNVDKSIHECAQRVFKAYDELCQRKNVPFELKEGVCRVGDKEISTESKLFEKVFENLDEVIEKTPSVAAVPIQEARPGVIELSIKTQSIWDGKKEDLAALAERVRQKQELPQALAEKAKALIADKAALSHEPRSGSGRSRPIMPRNIPIVLKQNLSGTSLEDRLQSMVQARTVCEKNKYTHLVIPTARIQGPFLIESRLSLPSQGSYVQVGQYLEKPERFNEAAREFTGFLCQAMPFDILGGAKTVENDFEEFCRLGLPRFDNLPLFLEKEVGKIAFIDTEGWTIDPDARKKMSWTDAIAFFPLHLDIILETAKKMDPTLDLEKIRPECEKLRDYYVNFCQKVYGDHRDLVVKKQKGDRIDPADPSKLFLSPEIINQVAANVSNWCMEAHNGNTPDVFNKAYFKGLLGPNPETTLEQFKEKLPTFLAALSKAMVKIASLQHEKNIPSGHLSTMSRRCMHCELNMFGDLGIDTSALDMFHKGNYDNSQLFRLVTLHVFQELAKQNEIILFEPKMTGRSWIYW